MRSTQTIGNLSTMLENNWTIAFFAAGLLFAGSFCQSALSKEATVWLCAEDQFERARKFPGSPCDYMDLFQPNAPWKQASQHVKVFKVTFGFLFRSSDEDLTRVFNELKRRHIALAIEGGLLAGHDGCGKGVEGYAAPLTAKVTAERIKKLGGQLEYLAMDEPLWYGHHFDGQNACHATMEQLAQDVAIRVAQLRSVFPDVQIGDIEPVGAQSADWVPQILQWAQVYQQVVGEPLAFFHADIAWHGPWREQLIKLDREFKRMKIPLGIIYDGFADKTDQEWTAHALLNAVIIEHELHLQPDAAILQTWERLPSHLLPETQAGTMTNFVDRYCAKPTTLQLRREGGKLMGRLVNSDGNAVGDQSVMIRTSGGDNITGFVSRQLTGTVPANATTAVIGLRIDQSAATGAAVIDIGPAQYRADGTGQPIARQFQVPVANKREHGKIFIPPGQKLSLNVQGFPVTPGESFTFSVPVEIFANPDLNGNVDIIFLDQSHKQISYEAIPLVNKTESHVVGSTRTDEDGRFSLSAGDFGEDAAKHCYLEFSGDTTNRFTRSEPFIPRQLSQE